MRKRIIGLLVAAIIALTVIGCGEKLNEPTTIAGERLKQTDAVGLARIYVDMETGVCYIANIYGGIEVMVDHDGKPYIENGFRDWSDGDGES